MQKSNFKAYLAYTSVCILWGTTYVAIRVGVEHVPPFLFAGLRWLISGSIFFVYLKLTGKKLPTKNEIIHLSVVGISLLGISNGFLGFAEQWIPSGLASLIITTIPFWVVGMELVLPSGPKLNLLVVAGLLLGLLGVVIISINDIPLISNNGYMLGMLSLFIVVVFWAFGSVYSKYKKLSVDPLMGASIQMIIGGLAQTIAGLSIGEASRFSFDTNSLIAFIYLITVASIVGYGSYIYMITHLPLSFASTYAYVNPVIALFLGWFILDEKLNMLIFIGAAVILGGVIVVKAGVKFQQFRKPKKTKTSF